MTVEPIDKGTKRQKSAVAAAPSKTATSLIVAKRGRYSDKHQPSFDLWDGFFVKVRAQEEMFVKAGMPADGLTDFLIKWFDAWEQRDVVALRALMADDLAFAEPMSGSSHWTADKVMLDFANILFRACPDMVFHPQDDTIRALPYYDFLDGNVRLAVPFRWVGRFRYTLRPFDVVGVDRYNLVRDPERGWLVARIDTDNDLLSLLGQVSPIPIRAPKQRTVKLVLGTLQKIFPGLHGPVVRPFTNNPH